MGDYQTHVTISPIYTEVNVIAEIRRLKIKGILQDDGKD
jgi:hypothetical protein